MKLPALLLLAVLLPQDQAEIDKAIDRGAAWLLKQYDHLPPVGSKKVMRYDELVLLTLVHAGIDPERKEMQHLLKIVTTDKLQRTYLVSLQAMALAKIDRAKWQWRIAQCAQFLVDNQLKHGQWSYGEEVKMWTPSRVRKAKPGTTELPLIRLKRRGWGTGRGDNSNSQYAMLGLRAAMDSAVDLPDEVLELARKWWIDSQHSNGGWGYQGKDKQVAKGSMTTAGVAALTICDYYLKKDYRSNLKIKRGMKWISDHFTVEGNPIGDDIKAGHHYYFLYGMERAGMLYGTEEFFGKAWYKPGAKYLLKEQGRDGRWTDVKKTCFAILFLRRATPPLGGTATVGAKK